MIYFFAVIYYNIIMFGMNRPTEINKYHDNKKKSVLLLALLLLC